MSREDEVKQSLEQKFPYLKDAVNITGQRRVFTEAPYDNIAEVFNYSVSGMKFSFLSAITGFDEVERFCVIYHLSREDGIVLNLRIHVSKENPVINTITNLFPYAEMYERELEDLLGIKVIGLPPGRRYPLPDNWPMGNHPLRKEWKGTAAPANGGIKND